MITRRAALGGTGLLACPGWGAQPVPPPKRIAAVVTEYRLNSHADVIVGKYLEGYRQDGRPPGPRIPTCSSTS